MRWGVQRLEFSAYSGHIETLPRSSLHFILIVWQSAFFMSSPYTGMLFTEISSKLPANFTSQWFAFLLYSLKNVIRFHSSYVFCLAVSTSSQASAPFFFFSCIRWFTKSGWRRTKNDIILEVVILFIKFVAFTNQLFDWIYSDLFSLQAFQNWFSCKSYSNVGLLSPELTFFAHFCSSKMPMLLSS